MRNNLETRIKAVEASLKGGTLKETATKFNIHYITLCRWVQWYKKMGKENSKRASYIKPWNRPAKEIEEKVMLLKEHDPALTVRKAQYFLKKKKNYISIKGIYEIWRRYNLVRRPAEFPFSPYGPLTPESQYAIEQTLLLLKKGDDEKILKNVARILNELPSFPDNHEELLRKIPDRFLSLKRRMEKLDANFLKTPKPELLKQARKIRKALEKKKYFYSSIIAGILEILALHWMRTPEQELKLNMLLRKRQKNLRDPVMNLALTFLAGSAYAELLDVKKARECGQRCKRLLRSLPNASVYTLMGDYMTFITDYQASLNYYHKALDKLHDEKPNKHMLLKAALAAVIAGEYQKCASLFLRKLRLKPHDDLYATFVLIKALLSIGYGKLERATYYLKECLEKSQKEQFRNYIYTTISCLAVINKALGKKHEAERILRKYLPIFKKYSIKRHILMIEFLLSESKIDERATKLPIFYLLKLVDQACQTRKQIDYRRALNYAKRKGLLGFFHRMTVFYPEMILALLKKGKKTSLPNSILKLPIFNKEMLVYHLKFLGHTIVYKNQRYLKAKFSPKEEALLITLAQRMGEPGKSLLLNDIYQNFWHGSKDPSSRLSHMLVQIKNKLMLPKHLINIISHNGAKRLTNRGFYITTDYKDFNMTIAEARAIERIGEWSFARKKYLQAFGLIRGEPFRKMYDNWSENMRHVILNRVERESQYFIKICILHKNKKAVKMVSAIVSKIIAYKEKIQPNLYQ